ncbi:MAG: MATE family efflux transporter [Ruminococcaceae bacterium]|nr:MATE family efflux transporter [Oscillospiraceae bacterium]
MLLTKEIGSVKKTKMLFTKKQLVGILIPLILEQLLSVAVGAVDTVMVAYAGEAAVSGVSLVNALDVFLVIFFTAFVSGGAVIVAHALGRKDEADAQIAAKQLLYSSVIIAVALAAVTILFRKPILSLFFGNAEPDVMRSAESYFFYLALSFPMLAACSSVSAMFRVAGNTRIALVVSLITNVINICGNATFIIALKMGASGAALGTLIARFAASVIMIALVANKKSVFHIERILNYRPNFSVVKRILSIGIPNGVENGMFQLGRLLTQTLISSMGTAVIAANAVALTVCNFQYVVGNAYSSAMITVVGQSVGAGEEEQAKYYSRLLTVLNYISLGIVIVLTLLLLSPIVFAYSLSPESAHVTKMLITYHCFCAIIMWPIGFMLPSAFRAAGDVRYPMVISIISMWVFRIAGGYMLALETVSVLGLFELPGLGMGIMGVWIAMTVDWLFRATLFAIRYVSGRWLGKLRGGIFQNKNIKDKKIQKNY